MLDKTIKKESVRMSKTGVDDGVDQKAPDTYNFIDLPMTRLHYVKYGEGPPLVIVPATISEIDNWLSLVHFMGQRFTVYFFELPGHGQSSRFAQRYKSELVAQTVEDFIDALGFETISLMGFSFGGVLTMKILYLLQDRIERVIMLSPAVTHRAVSFGPLRKFFMRAFANIMGIRGFSDMFGKLAKNDRTGIYMAKILRRLGKVEESIPLERRFKEVRLSTLEVVFQQLKEMLYLEQPDPVKKFSQPCYITMSVNDPLLDFDTTLDVIHQHFEHVELEKLYVHYHQPKVIPTLSEFNRDYANFLEMLG